MISSAYAKYAQSLKGREARKRAIRAFYKRNREQISAKRAAYYQKYKEKITTQKREYSHSTTGREIMRRSRQKYWDNKPLKERWAIRTLIRHRWRGFHVPMKAEELLSFVKDKFTCAMCGDLLDYENINHVPNKATLDILDTHSPLILGNIQIVCSRCNITKGNLSKNEFLTYITRILNIHYGLTL